jgi:hypothetical protein
MNTDTEEVFEVNMKFSELEDYFKQNPHCKQVFNKFPGLGDSVRLGIRKPDDGFRDALREVKNSHKRNSINTF